MWYIILGLIAAIYVILNVVIPSTLSSFIGTYVIRPLLWIFLSIAVLYIAKQEELTIWQFKKIRRWQIGTTPLHAALLIGGFQVSLLLIAGFFIGFGKSPYSHTIPSLFINMFYVATMLFGVELSRAYLIKKSSLTRRNINLALVLVTILFMFITIPFIKFTGLTLSDPAGVSKFIGETIIPALAMSLFASYLVYIGGALPAIGYMGVLQAFEWFSPVLPNLDWPLAALIGTIGPAIGFLIIQNSIQRPHLGVRRTMRKSKIKDPALSWTGVAIVSLLIVFFSFGYFGLQPTIIYSGSMNPAFDVGDIVIISHVSIEDIQQGSIIQYRTGNMTVPVIHRVHELYGEGETTVFITKGDANPSADAEPVHPERIMGKAVFTIPKLGWIQIFIKDIVKKTGINI